MTKPSDSPMSVLPFATLDAPTPDCRRLMIGTTWDGSPLPPHQTATLELVVRRQTWELRVNAPYYGDASLPARPPGSTPRLWEHEVVELFVLGSGDPDAPRYTEIELGPHGHYLALRLMGVRQIVDQNHTLPYKARITGARWHGVAQVPIGLLPDPPFRVNAYAASGPPAARRHHAMIAVPGPVPDFHKLSVFRPLSVFTLEAIRIKRRNRPHM